MQFFLQAPRPSIRLLAQGPRALDLYRQVKKWTVVGDATRCARRVLELSYLFHVGALLSVLCLGCLNFELVSSLTVSLRGGRGCLGRLLVTLSNVWRC